VTSTVIGDIQLIVDFNNKLYYLHVNKDTTT